MTAYMILDVCNHRALRIPFALIAPLSFAVQPGTDCQLVYDTELPEPYTAAYAQWRRLAGPALQLSSMELRRLPTPPVWHVAVLDEHGSIQPYSGELSAASEESSWPTASV